MRSALAAVLLLLIARPAAAQNTIEPVTIKGVHGAIVMPKEWDGRLFLYAHGYTADKRVLEPIPTDITKANKLYLPPLLFTPPGAAGAFTTFRSVGWFIKDSLKDIEDLRRYFVKKHGKPKHTYIWGHSGGGLVTEAVIEYFPRTYEGAAPMCGPGAGGWRNFNAALDLRLLYEYICRDVQAARFTCRVCTDGASRCLADEHCPAGQTCGAEETPGPPEDGLTPECTDFLLDHPETFNEDTTAPGGDFVAAHAGACFGSLAAGGTGTAEQVARKDRYLRTSQLPDGSLTSALFFASIGMAEVFHRRTHERHAWGNVGVDYASPLLTAAEHSEINNGIARVTADADAVRFMRRYFEPRGRTRSKVVTVHAFDDPLVIVENEDKYREAFVAANREDQLVQLFTPIGGHCLFVNAWLPALQGLTEWVEQGRKPTTASVSAGCNGCLTTRTPQPWGLRVVERRAKGAPVRSLACDGEVGDCPAETTCVLSMHHCR